MLRAIKSSRATPPMLGTKINLRFRAFSAIHLASTLTMSKKQPKHLVDPTQLKPIDSADGTLQVIIETPKFFFFWQRERKVRAVLCTIRAGKFSSPLPSWIPNPVELLPGHGRYFFLKASWGSLERLLSRLRPSFLRLLLKAWPLA